MLFSLESALENGSTTFPVYEEIHFILKSNLSLRTERREPYKLEMTVNFRFLRVLRK